MTTQGEAILAFLDRAIAERAATARSADKELGSSWSAKWDERTDSFDLVTDIGIDVAADLPPGVAGHAALNDPASVLRRCAADRKLIAELRDLSLLGESPAQPAGPVERMALSGIRAALRALAKGYGWTEDER